MDFFTGILGFIAWCFKQILNKDSYGLFNWKLVLSKISPKKSGKSPLQLVQMPPMIIERAKDQARFSVSSAEEMVDQFGRSNGQQPRSPRSKTKARWDSFKQSFQKRAPFFSCC